jgi:glycerol uptake facilitator-like aquaporin
VKGSIILSSVIARKALAESLGTFLLVFLAVGSAVFGINKVGAAGVAFAFGLVLLALAYSIGPVSGCHVNPAVTLAVLLRRGITVAEAGAYWLAQVAGAVVGGVCRPLGHRTGGRPGVRRACHRARPHRRSSGGHPA